MKNIFKEIKTKLKFLKTILPHATFVFLLVMPASTNYKLKDYGFGNGGASNATSTNYAMEVIAGEQSAGKLTGVAYNAGTGLSFTNQANVPSAPTFSNPSNYYNKLQIILNTSGNPTDTKYAIAISTDNFVTTNYVKSDNTVGATLILADYQTYATWGGGSGFYVIGLTAGTTYKVKVKAMQGKFTETGYGPIATAATVNPTLSFDIDVSSTDSKTAPPFTINFGSLPVNTVTDSPQKIWVDFATNGELGGKVYVAGQNAGLTSATKSYTISAMTGNLAGASEGFGAQGSSVAQSSGGPLTVATLYDQIGSTVGIVDSAMREMFSSTGPIVGGRGSFLLKAKTSTITPSATDYSEIFTVIASGNF
ncbi:MAG: hypothetical protein Q7T51_01725 [Candidatus Moranbacteria bacterium]|nr:hypothetical protein [Candidatus Moranbacteria bacterium]